MNAIRVQIHLKHFFDDNSSAKFYNFWYSFQPSKLSTMKDILEDIRINYIQNQLSLYTEDNDERSLIIHLNDCQLLPFTSSQILRDNDRLILMPITKYKLYRTSLQDSVNLNVSSSMITESMPSVTTTNVPEINQKRQRIESVELKAPSESTITLISPVEIVEEQPRKKKIKTKPIEDQISQSSPVIQSKSEPHPVIEQTPAAVVVEKEILSEEAPVSLPSTNGRIRELKSKTPAWKAQPPAPRGNPQNKVHIRFDSDSDEELSSQVQPVIEKKNPVKPSLSSSICESEPIVEDRQPVESSPHTNGSNSSVRIEYVPRSTLTQPDIIKTPDENTPKKKTVDLLFDMKQHKNPHEKLGKRIQQQYGRKRAQNRKRALDYFSMTNFLDQAFGLNKDDLEKQITSSNEYQTSSSSSSTQQTLPTSFSKLARLPLVAEAIDDNEKMYDLYPPLTRCPSVQTRIAFKILELNEDFCPTMSSFKEGTVIEVDANTNELTIELDKPIQNVFQQPSKFYAPTDNDDENAIEETSKTMTVSFADLNSVRLLTTA